MVVNNNTTEDLEKNSYNTNNSIATDDKLHVEKSEKRNYMEDVDRGYAWIVIIGCFLVDFVILGYLHSFGIFLNHYVNHDFKGKLDTFSGSWIGTLAKFLKFLMGICAGPLADKIGYRTTLSIGAILLCLGQLLSSFSTEVWHLFLSQGFLVGLGASLAYYPAISAPTFWFKEKKGIAFGICIAGSGIGNLIWSPMISYLLENYGFRWCNRICCLITAVCMCISFLLIRVKPKSATTPKKSLDIAFFKDPKFISYFYYGFVASFGFLVPFYLLPTYGKARGISLSQSGILVGLIGGASAVGRIILGWAASHTGRINMLFVLVLLSGLSCLLVWSFANSFGLLVLFVVIYGASTGGFNAIMPAMNSDVFSEYNIASVNGLVYVSCTIPTLVGTPIAALILKKYSTAAHQNFTPVILYAGFTLLAASAGVLSLKYFASGKLSGKA